MRTEMSENVGFVLFAVIALVVCPTQADTIVKSNNTYNLNLASSWTNGVAPGGNDIAQWDSTVTVALTNLLGADLGWSGLRVLNPGGVPTINAGNTLTLGPAGVDMSTANNSFTLNCALALAADQSWNAGTKQLSVYGPVNMGGHTVAASGSGSGKIQFKNTVTGGGTLITSHPNTQMSGGAFATTMAAIVLPGGLLQFDSGTGTLQPARLQSVTLNGGTVAVVGVGNTNTVDAISGALTVDAGSATVTVTPNAARNAQLTAGSLIRTNRGEALLRGTALGVNALASAVANSASIGFTSAPGPLLGAGGGLGSTTLSVLPWAFGDTNVAGNGASLVTYDAGNGIRPLSFATEYTSSISAGEAASNNVRLVAYTNTLATATIINGLVLGAGSLINGAGRLTVASGALLATANSQVGVTNAPGMLDFGGAEGVINVIAGTLTVAEGITGSGGLTKGGAGSLVLGGGVSDTVSNRYSGTTIINSGTVSLSKSNGMIAIPGDVVINSGSLQQWGDGWSSYLIASNCSMTVNSGTYYVGPLAGNLSKYTYQTLSNLFVLATNASVYVGNSNPNIGNSSLTILGTTVLSNGILHVHSGYATFSTPGLTLWGAANQTHLDIGNASSGDDASFTIGANGLTIYQPTNGVCNLASMVAWSGRSSYWNLQGDLTYNGNSANTNAMTTTIGGNNPGRTQLVLNAPRTFTINPGGGSVDLILAPNIVGANTGLIKDGKGTLMLTYASTYTGPTTVRSGTLLVNGSLASGTAVTNYATLGGTGLVSGAVTVLGGTLAPGSISIGRLTLGNNLTFTNAGPTNAVCQIKLGGTSAGTNYDQLVLTSQSAKLVLTNTILSVSLVNGFVPVDGSTFTIIDNQGSNSIQGAFSGLPAKSSITAGSTAFRISYVGGTGNDVVLTAWSRGSAILFR